jgi:ketosteroid isomerase-like protein
MSLNNNRRLIEDFYTAFKQKDAEGMVACYHEEITFEDPVFGILKGTDAKNMWRMLLASSKDLDITFNNIQLAGDQGKVRWEALYTFSKTGRKVHNKVEASFIFKEGRIWNHRDDFSFSKWSSQAFGMLGLLLGYTRFLKTKIRRNAHASLAKYKASRGGRP